jgi:two-component system, sporulation sensor kinase E
MIAQLDIEVREQQANKAQREAQRATLEAHSAIDLANRTREEFLARMSHELRTPLNAVIGFSRVLESNRSGNQRPEDIELLKRVRAGGEKLLDLIEDVLEHSHLGNGDLELERRLTDVTAIVNRVSDDYRGAAVSKGLSLRTVLPHDAARIPLDAGRLAQVLEHLVENAIKFTPQGDVQILLATDAATRAPSRLIVSDTGIGIPEEEIQSIFTAFHQVDAGARRSYDGAGLGLPLARRLCAAMGCHLSVESEVGQGSRFTIRFPRAEVGSEPTDTR